jgi:eukaryotic-like serine/threonine-protein kinase
MPSSRLLAGRYRLHRRIATGGAGEVWQALDTVLARPVAVKLLRAEFAGHADALARFRAEARHAGKLSHPAIAQVYDYGEGVPPDPPFLVMELVDGPSLATVLAGRPLAPGQAMNIVAQVADGLATAHAAGLVHRDIKPANLLLGPGGKVKITDFGIAAAAGSAPVTRAGTVIGTPAYLAPERLTGAPATAAADLYSLGVVGYECLTGTVPFTGSAVEVAFAHQQRPLPPFPPAIPVGAADLIRELTAKDPAARPASAAVVAGRAGHVRELLDSPRPLASAATWAAPPGVDPAVTGPAVTGPAVTGPAATAPAVTAWLPVAPAPARRPPDRRVPGRPWLAAAVVALAVLALSGLVLLLRSTGGPPAGAAAAGGHPASASSRPPATVELAAGTLIGQPLSVVRPRLFQLGLTMQVRWQQSDSEPGTVLAIEPSGPVRAGSTVVVTVAAGQGSGYGQDHGNGGGDGNGGGQGGNGN